MKKKQQGKEGEASAMRDFGEGSTSTVTHREQKVGSMVSHITSFHTMSKDRISSDMMEPQYISKPTVIMCNPNALYY